MACCSAPALGRRFPCLHSWTAWRIAQGDPISPRAAADPAGEGAIVADDDDLAADAWAAQVAPGQLVLGMPPDFQLVLGL
jgi:hypothetical protein